MYTKRCPVAQNEKRVSTSLQLNADERNGVRPTFPLSFYRSPTREKEKPATFSSGPGTAAAPLTNVKLSKSVNPRIAVKTACEPSAAAAGSRYFR